MKTIFKISVTLLTVLTISLMFCGMASALPTTNDLVTVSYGPNHASGFSGGDFLLIDGNESYISFCVEHNEYLTLNTSLTVESVGLMAHNGGTGVSATYTGDISGVLNNYDPVSGATKWLMNEYINNDLYDFYSGQYSESFFSAAMQAAIWRLENENYGSSPYDVLANELFINATINSSAGLNLDNVYIVNLLNATGGLVQSQLIATTPTPEPASMLLLGCGLFGLAAFGRKKMIASTSITG